LTYISVAKSIGVSSTTFT